MRKIITVGKNMGQSGFRYSQRYIVYNNTTSYNVIIIHGGLGRNDYEMEEIQNESVKSWWKKLCMIERHLARPEEPLHRLF